MGAPILQLSDPGFPGFQLPGVLIHNRLEMGTPILQLPAFIHNFLKVFAPDVQLFDSAFLCFLPLHIRINDALKMTAPTPQFLFLFHLLVNCLF